MNTFTLRHNQHEAFHYLFRHLLCGHGANRREALMNKPTGAGKTLTCHYLLGRLLETERYISATIIAPQHQIMDGFFLNEDEDTAIKPLPVEDHLTIRGEVEIKPEEWWATSGKKGDKAAFSAHIRSTNPSTKGLVSSHQAVARWYKDNPQLLPADLAGRILVVDEAHHASTRNSLGSFVGAWKAAGGTVIYLTATAFRTDGKTIMENAARFTLTLAEHIQCGFAPRNVKIRSHHLPVTARTVNQLAGVEKSSDDHADTVEVIADLHESDGNPKAVIILPSDSGVMADALQTELGGRGVRVFNAVGAGKTKELMEVLQRERQADRYGGSEYGVILACARFNEGTDWAFCSHVYNIGLSYSFLLILQRLGRALRFKGKIDEYPEQHKDHAVFTFMVPAVSDDVFSKFESKHDDHAFLLACFMADMNTAQDHLGVIQRFAGAVRTAKGSTLKQALTDLAQSLHADVEDSRVAAGQVVLAISGLRRDGIEKPTSDDVKSYMANEMSLSGDDLAAAEMAVDYKVMGEHKEVFNSLVSRLLRKVENRGKTQDPSDPNVIKTDLRAAFDEMKAEFKYKVMGTANVDAALVHLSQFTGKTAQGVAEYLSGRLHWFAEFIKHLRAYKAERGHCKVPGTHICEDGYTLGSRANRVRSGANKATEEQRTELDSMGFIWDLKVHQWSKFTMHFRAYTMEFGHCCVPALYLCADGYKLGSKVRGIRSGSKITDPQKAELDRLGFVWDSKEYRDARFFEHLRAFVGAANHCRVPQLYICADGYKLGQYVSEVRSGAYKLSDDQRARLDTWGFVWDLYGLKRADLFMHIREYASEFGHPNVHQRHVCVDGYKLGRNVARIRSGRIKTSNTERAELSTLGFIWDLRAHNRADLFTRIQSFWAEKGHCDVPTSHICEDGFKLGSRVIRIRSGKYKTTETEKALLDSCGFRWGKK